MRLTLPNLISLARLCLVPVVLLAIWHRQYERALVWCFIAAATDALDGFLARRLHAESRLGAYLDPVGDKVLLSGIFLTLGFDHAIPLWLPLIVVARDALILSYVAWAFLFTEIREFEPSVWGKASTAIQILTALVMLLARAKLFGPVPSLLEPPLIGLTVLAAVWTAIHYSWVGWVTLQRQSTR